MGSVFGQITRYVTVRSLRGVAGALLVLTALIVLLNFVELSRTAGGRTGEVSALDVTWLALLESPGVILRIMPFAFLFGVLSAFMGLNRSSELVALRAAGVSAWRFVAPATVVAALMGVVSTAAFNPVAAAMTSQFEKAKADLSRDQGADAATPAIWLRQGDKREQIIIRAKSTAAPGVHLIGVSMFQNLVEPDGRLRFVRRIEATDAVLKHDTWTLTGVREFTPGGMGSATGTVQLRSSLSEATALERFTANSAIAFWSLPDLIARTEAAGISATAYRLQYQQLLATPLMYAAMATLAAAFSLRLLRLGGLVQLAASGVGLGFVFFFFNEVCSALGRSEALPAVVAGWAPPLLALIAGVTLLCFTEDG